MNDIRDVEILEFSDGKGGKRKYRLIPPTDGSTPKSLHNVRLQAFDKRTKKRHSVDPKMILKMVPKPVKHSDVLTIRINGSAPSCSLSEAITAHNEGKLVVVELDTLGTKLLPISVCNGQMHFMGINSNSLIAEHGSSFYVKYVAWTSSGIRNTSIAASSMTAVNETVSGTGAVVYFPMYSGFLEYSVPVLAKLSISPDISYLRIDTPNLEGISANLANFSIYRFTVPDNSQLKGVGIMYGNSPCVTYGMPAEWVPGEEYLIQVSGGVATVTRLCRPHTKYDYVEYITGALGGMIDTGIPLLANDKVEAVFEAPSSSSGQFEALFGARTGPTDKAFVFFTKAFGNPSNRGYARNGNEAFSENVFPNGEKVRLVCNGKTATVYDMTGTQLGQISNTSATLVDTERYCYVFDTSSGTSSIGRDHSSFTGKLYSFKIYDSSGNAKFSGQPASMGGVFGLFDSVSGKFFGSTDHMTSHNTGVFLPPEGYVPTLPAVPTVPQVKSQLPNTTGRIVVGAHAGKFTDYGTLGANIEELQVSLNPPMDSGYVPMVALQFTLPANTAFTTLTVKSPLDTTANCKMSGVPSAWEAGKTYQVSVISNCAFVCSFD